MAYDTYMAPAMDAEHKQDSPGAMDRQIVGMIWGHIEQLLSCGAGADASIRQLTSALPPLDAVPTQELRALAHLHLNSASHLMATLRLLVPDAFKDSANEPNMAALVAVSGAASLMVSTLIELQLLHLGRARDVTAQMRARISQRRAAMQQQEHSALVTSSSGSDPSDEDTMVFSLE